MKKINLMNDDNFKHYYSLKIADNEYKIPIRDNQIPFNITFSWNGTEKTITLVNGEDIFLLAGMFEKLLKDYGIEYKSETTIR